MNAYDFDKTIYHYDSTITFYLWCLRRYPRIALKWPRLIKDALLFRTGRIDKRAFVERFHAYLRNVPDVAGEVERFWDRHMAFMHAWYRRTHRTDDILLSASPLFLVEPAAKRLGIHTVFASPLNPATCRYEGERCHGEGKVRLLRAALPDIEIDEFYSDSLSDAPMAKIAGKAWLVDGEALSPWPAQTVSAANERRNNA